MMYLSAWDGNPTQGYFVLVMKKNGGWVGGGGEEEG